MDIEHIAFERLRQGALMSERYYEKPLMITYSGGKDSDVIVNLAIRSGINFEVVNSHTTADAPQTVRYIREQFKKWENQGIKCTVEYPTYQGNPISMWRLIPLKKMPPTRIVRYCCSVLKETSGDGRAIATGVRWAESNSRRNNRGIYEDINANKDKRIILTNDNDDNRRLIEQCEMRAKTVVNSIIDWADSDVWNYLHDCKCNGNPLYQCGFDRVGCIGCPMANKKRKFAFSVFPKYRDMYIRAFDRMIKINNLTGSWKTGYDCYMWWMSENPAQIVMPGFEI